MWQPETENQTNSIEAFTKALNDCSWENLTEEEVKNLRRQAINIIPNEIIPGAIIKLMTALLANLSKEQQEKLKIQETYVYLFKWALHAKCKEVIIFLIEPGTKQNLSLPDNLEQHKKVIDHCIAQNSFEIAAALISNYKDSLSNEQILVFLYDALNNSTSKDFDIFILDLLKSNTITQTLLENFAQPDPLLTFLAKYDLLEIFDYLVGKNINTGEKNKLLLEHAIDAGNSGLINTLKKNGVNLIIFDEHYLYFKLNQYVKSINLVGINYLIKYCKPAEILLFKDPSGRFLVHYFSEHNDIENLKLISGVFINFKNTKEVFSSEPINTLHKSTLGNYLNVLVAQNTAIHIATVKKHLLILNFLLENGANPNIPNHEGITALHYAAKYNLQTTAKTLLTNKNTNPNVIDEEGNTPLHEAVLGKDSDMVRLLLRFKADPTIKNKRGEKPSDLVDADSDIKTILETRETEIAKRSLVQKDTPSLFNKFSLMMSHWGFNNDSKTNVTAEQHKELSL